MPLTLTATPGASDANAYLDLTAAQAIIDETPNADAWTNATGTAQTQALVAATRMLDVVAYQGVKQHTTQALSWPRGGVLDPDYGRDAGAVAGYMTNGWGVYLDWTTIPKRIQRATVMLALEILRAGTSDVWGVDADANVQSKAIDVIRTDFVPVGQRRFGLRVYPSVWREVYPLTQAAQGTSVERA